MSFTMRVTKPEAGNRYYIRKASGGWSNAIQGSPKDAACDVLANCVGYAVGRFNEIGGYGCCRYLAPVNAENFMQYKGSCRTGMIPKPGACMVWQKGASLSGSDGAGHVAIVEKVISATEVFTSESGYGSQAFWNQTRRKGADGRWGAGPAYTFLGFIYNPAVPDEEPAAPLSSDFQCGDAVRIRENAVYYDGKKPVPDWVKNKTWIIRSISGDRVVIDRSEDGKNAICSPIHRQYLMHKEAADTPEKTAVPYIVKVTIPALNIRRGPGTNFSVAGCIRDRGVYTITEEQSGPGASCWGRLKSGAGWIALDYTSGRKASGEK